MSVAAARHFFFLEKVRTGSACIGINLPLKKRPADGGEQPTPPWAALAQASRKCTFAQLARGYPGPLCRLLAEKLAAIRRRKEKNVDENKKEHHLHIVLTTQQYQLLCCASQKECRLTKRAYLARLIEGRPVKAALQKKLKSSGRKYIISATTSTRLPAASMPELRSRRMPNGDSIFWIRYMSLCSG